MKKASLIEPPAGATYTYRDFTAMGEWVSQRFGRRAYTLAIISHDGRYSEYGESAIKDVAPPPPDSVEALAVAAGLQNAVIDMRNLDASADWLRQRRHATPMGHYLQTAPWPEIFDGFVLVRTMMPSTFVPRDAGASVSPFDAAPDGTTRDGG